MSITKQLHRLSQLHQMICRKSTGTPIELSKKVKVSERQIHYYLGILKEMGAPIEYCYKRKTYYYKQEGAFNFKFYKEEN